MDREERTVLVVSLDQSLSDVLSEFSQSFEVYTVSTVREVVMHWSTKQCILTMVDFGCEKAVACLASLRSSRIVGGTIVAILPEANGSAIQAVDYGASRCVLLSRVEVAMPKLIAECSNVQTMSVEVPRVLLLLRDESEREFCCSCFEEAGFSVLIVPDLEDALVRINKSIDGPQGTGTDYLDLIIVDTSFHSVDIGASMSVLALTVSDSPDTAAEKIIALVGRQSSVLLIASDSSSPALHRILKHGPGGNFEYAFTPLSQHLLVWQARRMIARKNTDRFVVRNVGCASFLSMPPTPAPPSPRHVPTLNVQMPGTEKEIEKGFEPLQTNESGIVVLPLSARSSMSSVSHPTHRSSITDVVPSLQGQIEELKEQIELQKNDLEDVEGLLHETLWKYLRKAAFKSIPMVAKNIVETDDQIGPYSFGQYLGNGAYSTVRAGIHQDTNRKVAIKIIKKDKIRDPIDLQRIDSEIKALKMCRHAHIVNVLDVMHSPKHLYIVEDYVGGGDYFSLLNEDESLPESQIRELFYEICSAVQYCHSRGICHRDIKPENILMEVDGHVKLADFGFAAKVAPTQKLRSFCGSPGFTAPEMYSAAEFDAFSADVWSLGALLLETVCGIGVLERRGLVFDEDGPPEISEVEALVAGALQEPAVLASSKQLQDLLPKCLCASPNLRVSSSRLVRHEWFDGLSGPSSSMPGSNAAQSRARVSTPRRLRAATSPSPIDEPPHTPTDRSPSDSPKGSGRVSLPALQGETSRSPLFQQHKALSPMSPSPGGSGGTRTRPMRKSCTPTISPVGGRPLLRRAKSSRSSGVDPQAVPSPHSHTPHGLGSGGSFRFAKR